MNQVKQNLLYPPGGILIWIVVLVELITFMAVLTAFAVYRAKNPLDAAEGMKQMNPWDGYIYTILLITGGYFMANAIRILKKQQYDKASHQILLAMLFGLSFLVLKSMEYAHKIDSGYTWTSGTYFMFYWLITGFHFLHVLVAVMILFALYLYVRKNNNAQILPDVMMGSIFWHLCDIIWILIFPMFYLK